MNKRNKLDLNNKSNWKCDTEKRISVVSLNAYIAVPEQHDINSIKSRRCKQNPKQIILCICSGIATYLPEFYIIGKKKTTFKTKMELYKIKKTQIKIKLLVDSIKNFIETTEM
jgi:hypothetical protein